MSTYPPRRCGIATFTSDLCAAVGDGEVAVLTPADHVGPYPRVVHHRIRKDSPIDYGRAAWELAACGVDVVSIQHEYGIWGGADGGAVVDFARALTMPSVATLHTVLRAPTAGQRQVLDGLIAAVDRVVVMSQAAATILTGTYSVDPRRVEVIPHGVPDLPLVDPDSVKAGLGLAGRRVILSFGLLGPGKGYEHAIDAMPGVVAAIPDARYVVLGATHPELLRHEGETYREALMARVERLGLGDHVAFIDRFVGKAELGTWLQAADVFATPYPNLDQIVSGTLSYAIAAGRPVVSTPYAYAREILGVGRGLLVPPESPAALTEAFTTLLRDSGLRAEIGARAYRYSRAMVWPAVGQAYRDVFAQAAAGAQQSVPVPTRAKRPVDVGAPVDA